MPRRRQVFHYYAETSQNWRDEQITRLVENRTSVKQLPDHLQFVRQRAAQAVEPIKPTDHTTTVDDPKFLLTAKKLEAGRKLPPYYLVYFLLADLLGFRNLGKFEKVAWSIPLDFNGRAFLVEHAKFGLRLCGQSGSKADEEQGKRIVALIRSGTSVARPYFDWLAEEALENSRLNVLNSSSDLFARFLFFRDAHKTAAMEIEDKSYIRTSYGNSIAPPEEQIDLSGTWIHMMSRDLGSQAKWLALAAIDSFFSWTEQAFIHIAILRGTLTSGSEVAAAADADWATKFKNAIDLQESGAKEFYDRLSEIRRQLRNYMAHGAFGKQGEAFSFHSSAGAVPLVLPHKESQRRVSLRTDLSFPEPKALDVIERFLSDFLWTSERLCAEKYIMDSELPLILTYATDGTYSRAMASAELMTQLVSCLINSFKKAIHCLDDFVSRLRPAERRRLFVVNFEIVADGFLERRHGPMGSPAELLLRQACKEPLDQVDPRAVGRREVAMKS